MKKTIKKIKPAKLGFTDRSRVEQSLRNSELRYRRLFETAQDGILILDAQTGAITDVNPYLIDMLGYSREEFVEKKLWQVGAFKDIEASKDAFEALQRNAYIRYENLPLKTKGGRLIQVEFVSNVYSVGDDKVIQCNIRDITAHKQLVAALQENERKYRTLVTQSPDGIFLVDLSGNFTSANKAMCDALGISEEEFRSMNIWDIVPEQYLDQYRTRLTKILNGEILNEPSEYTVRGKDGKIIFIEVLSAPYYSDKGIIGFQGIARDITARKRAEEALRESEERFRAWIENSSDVVTVVGLDGTIQYESPSIEHLLGYKPEELIGTNAFDLLHPDDRERVMEFFAQNIQKPESATSAEFRFRHRDGSWRIFEGLGKSYLDEHGQMAGLINSRDITERIRAEGALRESEERYQTLARISPVGIFRTDPDGSTTYVNPKWCAISGLSVEEALGDEWLNAVHPDDKEKLSRDWQESAQLQKASFSDYRFVRPDGTITWVMGQAIPEVNIEGQTIGYVGTITDVTERKQAEEALRASQQVIEGIINAIPVRVFWKDKNLVYLGCNAVFARDAGFTDPKDVIGKDDYQMAWRDQAELYRGDDRQVIESGRSKLLIEEPQTTPEGNTIMLLTSKIPLCSSKGEVIGVLGTYMDITERKRAEETLRQRLAELEALHAVSSALRTAQTRDEALPILLDETLTALETDAGVIWLYHADSDELHAAVTRGWFRQFNETPMKPGEGIAGTVFATGQSHITAEFARDPVVRQPIAGQFPAGWGGVCLPIRTGAITVGTLTVSLPPPRQVTTEQMKLLESLTEMAGTTLHRMSLHEETVRQLDRLEALHSIDIAITASMDLRVTLNVLLEHVKTQLNADATCVLLLDPHTQTLEYAAGRGFRTRIIQTARIRLGENFAGRAALEQRAVQADDPAQIQKSPHFAALWAGEGFATDFGVPLIAKGEVKGVLEVYHRAPFHPEPDWISFLETLAGQAAIAIDNAQLFENLQRSNVDLALAYDATIEGWSRALDLRDKETKGHTLRVTEITMRLAKAMGIGDAELVHIRRGGLLHDIGKMGVPDSILFKPGPLTDDEWRVMRLHPQLAYDMLSPISYLHPALDIPYCHHEKWDGSGYPRGLKGEQIPFSARIFAVVDVWDALRSDRPYRPAWPEDKVLEHIRSLAGTHFDPQVVKVWLESEVLWTQAQE